jgi:hypothetical protein
LKFTILLRKQSLNLCKMNFGLTSMFFCAESLSVSVSRVLTLVNVLLGELLPKGEREKTERENENESTKERNIKRRKKRQKMKIM